MFVSKLSTGIAAVAMSLGALTLAAGGASAVGPDHEPDDTSTTAPTSDMVIGVGSDTSQHAVKLVGDLYNATNPTNKIFSYAACTDPAACGTIVLPSGNITRPNGSGQGLATLYTGSGNPDIDFARSSNPITAVERDTQLLRMFPFALDTVVTVVSGNVASNAPDSLTPLQIYNIYSCNASFNQWSEVGGSSTDTIKAYVPQSGSGTFKFFIAQIAAAAGQPSLGTSQPCWLTMQEHDPTLIKGDADAIAPFSKGRAAIETAAGNATHVLPGFSADRALYNVVRDADKNKPEIQALFGVDGFFCSAAAKSAIEAAGFKQLRRPAQGGACGGVTTDPTTNFAADAVSTTTTLTATQASASSAKLVAAVTGATAPNGSVTFTEGATTVAANVPLVSGSATTTVAAAPGAHTYTGTFTPLANSPFLPSSGNGSVTIVTAPAKVASSIQASFPKKVAFGKKAKGTVTVTLSGSSAKATGVVTVKGGTKTVGSGTLSNGSVQITLKKLKPGKHTLTVSWGGDGAGLASTTTVKIKSLPKSKS